MSPQRCLVSGKVPVSGRSHWQFNKLNNKKLGSSQVFELKVDRSYIGSVTLADCKGVWWRIGLAAPVLTPLIFTEKSGVPASIILLLLLAVSFPFTNSLTAYRRPETMLSVFRMHLPSDIPVVGCELNPYVQLQPSDNNIITDETPTDGYYLRYKWWVFFYFSRCRGFDLLYGWYFLCCMFAFPQ